jgi:hypothetical protein
MMRTGMRREPPRGVRINAGGSYFGAGPLLQQQKNDVGDNLDVKQLAISLHAI